MNCYQCGEPPVGACVACGQFYCDGCYDKAPTCDDCGWHIAEDLAEEHHRLAHTHD